jgi:hypothetical protein
VLIEEFDGVFGPDSVEVPGPDEKFVFSDAISQRPAFVLGQGILLIFELPYTGSEKSASIFWFGCLIESLPGRIF